MSKDTLKNYSNRLPDRQLLFETENTTLLAVNGEYIIDSFVDVLDMKRKEGGNGVLEVTNLRITWYSVKKNYINVSVGLNCIKAVFVTSITLTTGKQTQAIYINTIMDGCRFQFIFSYAQCTNPRIFEVIRRVWKAYESTSTYRDLKLRCAIIQSHELTPLSGEVLWLEVHLCL